MGEYPGYELYLRMLGEPERIAEGKHSKVLLYPSRGSAVKLFKEGLFSSFLKELRSLKLLTELALRYPKLKLAPELYSWNEELLAIEMELVKGISLRNFMRTSLNAEDKLELAERMIEAAVLLDLLKIQKEEMARPHKHVIITQLNPIRLRLIDFDRSTYPGKPANLPQLLQFLRGWLKLPEGVIRDFGKLYKSELFRVDSHGAHFIRSWQQLSLKVRALIGGSALESQGDLSHG